MTTLGKRTQELRKQLGWSQPELGKKTGTSRAIVGRSERGRMTPSIEVARTLADAFEVTVGSLVGAGSLPNAPPSSRSSDLSRPLTARPS